MHAGQITPIASPSTVTVSPSIAHGVCWLEFFAGEGGETRAVPTAGTVAFRGRPAGGPGYDIALTGSPMTASTPEFVTWSGPVDLITATPSSVSGNSVTHYRLHIEEYS